MSYHLNKLNHASLLRCLKTVYSGAARYCYNMEGKSLKEHLHFIELQIKYHERLKKKVLAQEKRIDKVLVDLNEQRNKLLLEQQLQQQKSK